MISKPYRRIIRPFVLGDEIEYLPPGSGDSYILDGDFAPDRVTVLRAYKTIESDLLRLFEYIEPATANLSTFSHRTFELLLRSCTEFESNCRSILRANGYKRAGNWTVKDYFNIERSGRLSDYVVQLSIWHEPGKAFQPFREWSGGSSLTWYRDYNSVKHDRSNNFPLASFENVLLAVCGLFVVMFSQFYVHSFVPHTSVGFFHQDDGWYSHQNMVFAIRPPQSWTAEECYSFNWQTLRKQAQPFSEFAF